MPPDQIIGIVSTVTTRPGRTDEYCRTLLELIETYSTQEHDCIDITVHRDAENPARILLYERWRISKDRFLDEQWTKSFIKEFTDRTRDMVVADEQVSYWNATEVVTGGKRTALPGRKQ